jgi:hypothetical protein
MTHSSPASAPRRRRLPRFSRGLCLAASLGTATVATAMSSNEAEAAPRVLREGTRPMAFLLGLGPSWGVGGSRWVYGDNYCAGGFCGWGGRYGGSFKLTQEFMGHFSGNASGPALGVILNQTFSGPYFGFNIAPKFTYDIRVKQGLGLYISPSVSLGYGLVHYRSRLLRQLRLRGRQLPRRQPAVRRRRQAHPRRPLAGLRPGPQLRLPHRPRRLLLRNNGVCGARLQLRHLLRARLDFVLGGGVTF